MAKTQAEYIEEQNRAAQAETEKRWKQREEQDAAYIAANNSAVDQSTAAALKPYETRMEQLPEEYRKQYDYNAVEELVRQKQVAETMANLGLTDSGLNRTQQTAIAVSRGNADAAARLSQQEKTQELQDKMDQLKATGEIQKQQTAAEVKANSQAWLNNLQSAAYENAANRGTALYEAEQQRLADAAALQKQLEWQREQLEWQKQQAEKQAAASSGSSQQGGSQKATAEPSGKSASATSTAASAPSGGSKKTAGSTSSSSTGGGRSGSVSAKNFSKTSEQMKKESQKLRSPKETELLLKGMTPTVMSFTENVQKDYEKRTGKKPGDFFYTDDFREFVYSKFQQSIQNGVNYNADEIRTVMLTYGF